MACKFEEVFIDWVPRPFGPGNVPMYTSDCKYEGDKDVSDSECGPCCPAYEEVKGE